MVKRGRHKKLMRVMRYKHRDDGFSDDAPDIPELERKERFLLEPLRGDELVVAQQVQSHVTHKGRCRYFPGANSRHWLELGNRKFNVESVTNWMERNKFLDWRLVEVT